MGRGARLGWPETPRLMGSQASTQNGLELGRQDLVQKQVDMAWLAASQVPEVPLVPWIVWESASLLVTKGKLLSPREPDCEGVFCWTLGPKYIPLRLFSIRSG